MTTLERCRPKIGSRYRGPSILKMPDGLYEHVQPELTVTEEELQLAIINAHLSAAWDRARHRVQRPSIVSKLLGGIARKEALR